MSTTRPTARRASPTPPGWPRRPDYDLAGNATSTTAGGVTTTRTYDGLARVDLETTDAGTIDHDYDAQGNETETTSADGAVTERTFSRTGWLLSETEDPLDADLTTTHTYDRLGRERDRHGFGRGHDHDDL